jgi:hypothetical protein
VTTTKHQLDDDNAKRIKNSISASNIPEFDKFRLSEVQGMN